MSQTALPAPGWRLPPRSQLALALAFIFAAAATLWFERAALFGSSEEAVLIETGARVPHPATIPVVASWHFDKDGAGGGAIVADIENGERLETLRVSIHPNTDAALPASHLIEITTPNLYPERKIVEIAGVYFKATTDAPGRPLIGAPVRVADDLHWFVMSQVPADRRANLSLMAEQNTLQINLLYQNGMQGILGVDKGESGKRAFEEAFAAWANSGT